MGERKAAWDNGAPKRILLATDLSARCDRALDLAVQLATQWGATVHVLHVIEKHANVDLPSWRRDRSEESMARAQIEADLLGRNVPWQLTLERGDPAQAILRHAHAFGCGLVVVGVARGEPLGRSTVGEIVEALAQQAPIPLLIVRSRPRRAYGRLAVATDFAPPSRHALECAVALFPAAEVTLLHAFHVPFEGFLDRKANLRPFRDAAERECAGFLAGLRQADKAAKVQVLIEHGMPEALLADYARELGSDLTVIGTQGRTGLVGFLVGSTGRRLISSLPGDALLVRSPAE